MTESYACRYCKKEFRKESTLAAHLCEPKRRWQQEKETGVQLGFRAYLRFFEITQGSAKLKTYGDFVASPYYIRVYISRETLLTFYKFFKIHT